MEHPKEKLRRILDESGHDDPLVDGPNGEPDRRDAVSQSPSTVVGKMQHARDLLRCDDMVAQTRVWAPADKARHAAIDAVEGALRKMTADVLVQDYGDPTEEEVEAAAAAGWEAKQAAMYPGTGGLPRRTRWTDATVPEAVRNINRAQARAILDSMRKPILLRDLFAGRGLVASPVGVLMEGDEHGMFVAVKIEARPGTRGPMPQTSGCGGGTGWDSNEGRLLSAAAMDVAGVAMGMAAKAAAKEGGE